MESTIDERRRALLAAGGGIALALAGCAAPAGPGRPDGTAAPNGSTGAPSGAGAPARGAAVTDRALARHLLDRFGYGPRPGDIDRLCEQGADAWLDAQLAPAQAAPVATSAFPGTHAATLAEFSRLQSDALRPGLADADRMQARRDLDDLVRRVQADARAERVLDALHSPRQLEASLVEVWFNHFNVFSRKETVRVTVGFYEREAIRPHVLGRFRDLLGATARHPAMLNYLDNWQSVVDGFRLPPGAPRPAGFTPSRGLNENYARELLELHTLGVDGGYSQADVTELARVFTGWSFDRRAAGTDDAFRFYPARHDPRPKTLLGQSVPSGGVREGEWALDLLARHPSTARHVARRLAVAYVADVPPPALVDRLAARYLQTDGDLREVVRALATSPEFRDPANRGAKFKTPYHYVLSAVRALDPGAAAPVDPARIAAAIGRMGMPIHGCPTPDGWKDTRATWLNAEALRLRVDFAVALAPRAGRSARPMRAGADTGGDPGAGLPETVAATLGPGAREALAEAAPDERLAIALASPDFMRR